jgi:hypothetical protein
MTAQDGDTVESCGSADAPWQDPQSPEWRVAQRERGELHNRSVAVCASGGQFLLAGSAGVTPGVRIHSGAGRIVSFHMRPLAIAEHGISEPTVSLKCG